ncbi:MAG TPA: polyprenyl synthetase family protein [Acidobacteria bacterium]|nr:polyprenyl synthetase family protein [Acidobacteriota bacterium]
MSEGLPSSSPASVPRMPRPRMMEVLSLVGDRLVEVEEEIRANLRSDLRPIDQAGDYLSEGGGKLIRPALMLLASGLLGYQGKMDVLLGAVFEFIHTATLVHDDIIDEADTRRGRPALNRVYGNEISILLGDYLYIRSMNMALRARKLGVIDILAESTEKMIEGEIMAHHLRGRADVTRQQHMEIIERKTAWLFSGCCRVAAVLADAGEDAEHRLGEYGLNLGIAFQLVDDLLDLTADEATLGKPVASDLREGRLTLPWIDLMHRGSQAERQAIEAVLSGGGFGGEPGWGRLKAALLAHGCLERTRRLAVEHATRAREVIGTFAPGPYREALMDLPDLVLSRDR